MKILIVSATAKENGLTCSELSKGIVARIKEPFKHDVDALVTGVGAVPTTFFLTRAIDGYQLVINIGIAGSFKPDYPLGSVVCVKEDAFGDYGIDERGTFRSLAESNLLAKEEFPFHGDTLVNPWLRDKFIEVNLPMVRGVTLSTASGSEERIKGIKKYWNADIETMESASVFYVCNLLGVKFVCLRAISNLIEPRDRSKWEFEKAVNSLTAEVRKIINGIS